MVVFRRPDASQERQHQEAGVPDLQIWKHELFPSGTKLARRRNENNQHRDLDGLGFRIPEAAYGLTGRAGQDRAQLPHQDRNVHGIRS